MAVASKPCVVSLLRRAVPALVRQQLPAALAIGTAQEPPCRPNGGLLHACPRSLGVMRFLRYSRE